MHNIVQLWKTDKKPHEILYKIKKHRGIQHS
jgi:hypothetical protein